MCAATELDLNGESAADGEAWSLFLAGDCCLDHADGGERRLLGPALERRADDADLSVVNLEAPVPTAGTTPIPKSGPSLTSAAGTPTLLAAGGFDVVTLANNHLMDYGIGGLDATRSACDDAGLRTVGAGEDHAAAVSPVRFDVTADTEVALFGLCDREFGVAGQERPGTAWAGHDAVDESIRQAARTADIVVVVDHGGIEYVPFSPPERRTRFRKFVEAGADLVVGHHPHVPQGWEVYEGAPIFHSLGNFLFDRQADDDTTSWGLTLDVEFRDATPIAVELVPTEMVEDSVVELDEGGTRDRGAHLNHLHRLAEYTDDDEQFLRYWQSVAVRLFHERYWDWLRTGLNGSDVRAIGDRYSVTGGSDGSGRGPVGENDGAASDESTRDDVTAREALLAMLNVIRNESHRSVVTTALSVITGELPDRRTSDVEQTTTDLLSWTERS